MVLGSWTRNQEFKLTSTQRAPESIEVTLSSTFSPGIPFLTGPHPLDTPFRSHIFVHHLASEPATILVTIRTEK